MAAVTSGVVSSLVGLAVAVAPLVLLGLVIGRLGRKECGAAEPARRQAQRFAIAALVVYLLILVVPMPLAHAASRRGASKGKKEKGMAQAAMTVGALWGLQWVLTGAALWSLRHAPTKGGCRGMLFALLLLPIALATLLFVGGSVAVHAA